MEFNLTILFLVPLGLLAFAAFHYGLRPAWRRTVERCADLDARDAETKARREAAERELDGDTHP